VNRTALIESFAGFPDRLAIAARASADRLIPDGDWTPAEIVRHLIAVESEVWQARIARLVAEDDPHWAWTEPGLAPGFDDLRLDEILAAFAGARAMTTATIRLLDEAGWARHGTHATYGRLDMEGLLRIAVDHDASHLEQLQRT
jgi:hypothetical protein